MNKKIYIEAGANDGAFQSRSLDFKNNNEYFGILIECQKKVYDKCVENRGDNNCKVYHCALVSSDFSSDEIELGISTIHSAMNSVVMPDSLTYSNKEKVPARTLQSILDENNISIVDYFFLDVEGYEKNVLDGIDFSKTSIKYLELECHYPFINMSYDDEKNMYKKYFIDLGYKLDKVIEGDGHPKMIFTLNE